jgi:hypothetical protein
MDASNGILETTSSPVIAVTASDNGVANSCKDAINIKTSTAVRNPAEKRAPSHSRDDSTKQGQ